MKYTRLIAVVFALILMPGLVLAGTTGTSSLSGGTSGTITIQPQAAAGTYNFNLPITVGTSGYVLTSQGGGSTAMTWVAPVDVLISTQTASNSASLSWTGLGSSYNTYFLDCSLIPATNTVAFEIQVGEGGTPTYETSNYWASAYLTDSGGNTGAYTSTGYILASASNRVDNVYGGSFQAWISSVPSTATYKMIHGLYTHAYSAGSYSQGGWFEGFYHGDTNAVTALKVLLSSGNITSGQCSLYGLNH